MTAGIFTVSYTARAHTVFNVDPEVYPPGRRRGLGVDLRHRPLPGDDGPDVLGVKALPQRGGPEPRRFICPRRKERDRAAPPALHRIPGLFHEPEERGEVGGLLFEGGNDGQPDSV